MQRLLLSALFVAGVLPQPARWAVAADQVSEAAMAAHAQCTIDYAPRWCIGYVVVPELQVLDKPGRGARPVGEPYRPLDSILVVEPIPRTPGWVKVKTLARPDRAVLGWVPRDQVALVTDFRKVIGCWPVAAINWHQAEAGDVPEQEFRLRFTEKGQVRELNAEGRPVAMNHAVYYSRGVFVIWSLLDDTDDLQARGMLHPGRQQPELRLELGRFLEPAYTMVDSANLSGCKDVPLVDAKPPVLKKPRR
jgi:hypothetical protein